MFGKKDISNKQRMVIELVAILLVGGAVLWTKSAPGQAVVNPGGSDVSALVRTHRLEVVDDAGKTRAVIAGKDSSGGVSISMDSDKASVEMGITSAEPISEQYWADPADKTSHNVTSQLLPGQPFVKLYKVRTAGNTRESVETAALKNNDHDGSPELMLHNSKTDKTLLLKADAKLKR